MHITRFTDYSLRVLIYLAIEEDRKVTVAEIAEKYQISKNHLMKVVQELNAKGFIHAVRGKAGGLTLASKAQEINIGQLVRSMEQGAALVDCFGLSNACIITPACHLKFVLNEALEAFYSSLEQYSLADLAAKPYKKQLASLLL